SSAVRGRDGVAIHPPAASRALLFSASSAVSSFLLFFRVLCVLRGESSSPRPLRWFLSGLRIDARCEEAAVDGDRLAGDEACRIRCEEHGRADELVRIAETAHRRANEELAPAFGAVEELGVEVGPEDSRGDRVDADTVGR